MTSGDQHDAEAAWPTEPPRGQYGPYGGDSASTSPSMQQEVAAGSGGWDDGAGTGHPVRRTLRDQYPELTQLASMSVDGAELRPFRLTGRSGHLIVDWLHNQGCYLIGDALDVTAEDMLDWPGIGRSEQAILLEFFRNVAADARSLLEARATDVPAELAAQPQFWADSAVDRIAAWARLSTGARTWGEAHDALTSAPVPEDVQAAVIELCSRVLPDDRMLHSAEQVASAWIAGLDDRNTAILRGRLLQAPSNTLDDVGKPFGVWSLTRFSGHLV